MLLSYQDSKHDHQLVVSDSIDSPHEHNNMMFVLQARPTLVPQWYLRPQQQHQPNRVVMIVVVLVVLSSPSPPPLAPAAPRLTPMTSEFPVARRRGICKLCQQSVARSAESTALS